MLRHEDTKKGTIILARVVDPDHTRNYCHKMARVCLEPGELSGGNLFVRGEWQLQ